MNNMLQKRQRRCPVLSLMSSLLCLLLLTGATIHSADLQCDVVVEKDATQVSFTAGQAIQTELLTEEKRSSKLFFKLSSGDKAFKLSPSQEWHIPEESSLFKYRVIPYRDKTLLIVALIDTVGYELNTNRQGFSIRLQDGHLRDRTAFLLARGSAYLRSDDTEEALADFKTLLELDRSNPKAQPR